MKDPMEEYLSSHENALENARDLSKDMVDSLKRLLDADTDDDYDEAERLEGHA